MGISKKFYKNFSMNCGCSALHSLFLARHNGFLKTHPLNWWASINFPFLNESLHVPHLYNMAKNAGLCPSLRLHAIPLQSLKIFVHLVFIHLAVLYIQFDYSAADSDMRTVPPPSHPVPFLFSFISLKVTVRWWYAVMSPTRCSFH